ncbi:MAG TPA: hypothetical protein VFK05_08800 [Polyangiaceae bacterium]|nr:hypothetical protein [Polyangiaceae bacterium]
MRVVVRLWLSLSVLALLGCGGAARDAHGIDYPSSVTPALPETPPQRPAPMSALPAAPVASPLPPSSTPTGLGRAAFESDAPIVFERASRAGDWLALCTPRHRDNADSRLPAGVGPRGELQRDSFERYLVTAESELPIDGLLGADASGRYAVLMQHGALLLWDAQSRKTLDLSALGADARLSAQSFAELRTVAFDEDSRHLLYVRQREGVSRIVIRSLDDGSERELDPGPGPIWRARFAPGGVFVIVELIREDSNKNGRFDFPAPLLTRPRPCSSGPGRYHTWIDRGDRPSTALVPLNGGAPLLDPDLVMPVGEAQLLRDASGALLLARAGKKRVLEPAACKGRIVHADAQRELFIVGCTQKKTGHVSLELVTPSARKPLAIELSSVELDREPSDGPRLVALYPGLETMLFDADRRELVPLKTSDVVLATRASRALIRRANSLLFYDADRRTEQLLAVTLDRYPQLLVTPPFVFISPALVNLDTATLVGSSPARPLALSSEGQLLVPSVEADGVQLARGPLRWLSL